MSDRNVYFASRIAPRTRVSTQEEAEKLPTTLVKSSETTDELKTVVAGQAAEIAELKQAMLILAQATKAVELNTDAISSAVELIRSDISVVVQQTAPKIIPWATIRKKLIGAWREILDEVTLLEKNCDWVTGSRVIGTVFQGGIRAPEVKKTQMREIEATIKTIKSYRTVIEQHYEYAWQNYQEEISELLPEMPKLSINSTSGIHKTQTWSINQILSLTFIHEIRRGMYARRGLKVD